MLYNTVITKNNLNDCLTSLAKEFRKLNGKTMPAEIILIGGASVLINYGFRDLTTDMDAIIQSSSVMKEAINNVGDKLQLPNGWLNTDFITTKSYSPKLIENSTYYKTFSNILTVRTVTAEYLIAMKLMAGRKYKNDLSDIIGILLEHKKIGKPISYEKIDIAIKNLYGNWEDISPEIIKFIKGVFKNVDLEALYKKVKQEESTSKDVLLEFENKYPNVTNKNNIEEILKAAKSKSKDKER